MTVPRRLAGVRDARARIERLALGDVVTVLILLGIVERVRTARLIMSIQAF